MQYVFIVNPAAGQPGTREAVEKALAAFHEPVQSEIYETAAPHDATRYVKEYAASHPDTDVRFIACGGDGTLNEVVCGAVGFPNVSVTCYPCGSGNDFVKYYGGKEKFLDIAKLVHATDRKIDLMRVNDTYSINIVNFGFDTCVCQTMINVRRKPLIGGKNAYTTGVVTALIKAMRTKCKITVDGAVVNDGDMLLCTIANGHYVGGAFKCAPKSSNEDGMLDICKVAPIPRLRFPKLLGPYAAGKHLDEDSDFKDVISYLRGKHVVVESDDKFAVSVDGEIIQSPLFDIEIMPGALRFAVPEGAVIPFTEA